MSFPSFPRPGDFGGPNFPPVQSFPGLGPMPSFPGGPMPGFNPAGMMMNGGMGPNTGIQRMGNMNFPRFPPGPHQLQPRMSMPQHQRPALPQQLNRMQMQGGGGGGGGLNAPPAPKSTTVWVGKIAPTLDDAALRLLLDACGPVKSWKRMEDTASKELKNFGFCEYEDADGVLRAVRLLNNLKVDGFDLAVKSNIATQKYVDEFEAAKGRKRVERLEAAKKRQEEGEVVEEPDTDTDQDNKAMETIMALVSEREIKSHASADRHRSSRAAAAAAEPAIDPDRPLPPPPSSGRMSERDSEAARERQMLAEFEQGRDKERREEDQRRREAEKAHDQRLREWDKEQGNILHVRERERERQRDMEAERRRAIRADLDADDTDEELEPWQRRLYRYSRRAIERRKRRAAEEADDAADRAKEAKEDVEYGKRYRRAPPTQRTSRPDGTPEGDERRASASRHATPEQPVKHEAHVKSEDATVKVEEVKAEPAIKAEPKAEGPPQADVDPEDPIFRAMVAAAKAAPHNAAAAAATAAAAAAAAAQQQAAAQAKRQQEEQQAHAMRQEQQRAAAAAAAVASTSGRTVVGQGVKRTALHNMFGDEEEEANKRKLKPIQYSEEELQSVGAGSAVGTEDPAVTLKRMMDAIPTSRDGVFAYRVKWHAYDPVSMGSKFRGWLNKKVTELLNSSEPALVEYVMEMLGQRMAADKVAGEFSDILGQAEAEVFVLKLWRMLIYETEKSAMGL